MFFAGGPVSHTGPGDEDEGWLHLLDGEDLKPGHLSLECDDEGAGGHILLWVGKIYVIWIFNFIV